MARGLACDFGIALKVPTFKADEPTEWALVVDISGRKTATYDTPTGLVFHCRHQRLSITQNQQLSTQFGHDDAEGIIQMGVVHLSNIQLPCDVDQLGKIILSVPAQSDSRRWVFEVLRALKRDLQISDLLRDPLGYHGDIFRSFGPVEERVNECFMYYIKKRCFRVAQFFL